MCLEKKSAFTTITAKVIIDKNSPYLNSVIINRGSSSRIKLGMPVLSEGNLVGRVVEVNFLSARILLLNDLNSKIPVMISPEGSQAILSGRGENKPKLEYLPEKFELNDDVSEISQEPPWRFGEEKNEVQLKVDRTHASWALEMIGEKALYEELSDGSIILYETVRDWRIFRTFVLSFLDAAELLEPPECRESLIEWLESIQ